MNKWNSREIIEREHLLDEFTEYSLRQQKKLYLEYSKNIINEIMVLYNRIINGDIVIASDLYSYNRYYRLLNSISEKLNKLAGYQKWNMDKNLTDLYKKTSSMVGQTYGFTDVIPEDIVEASIRRVWVADGLDYSTRIWNDKTKLLEKIESGITECVATGSDPRILRDELVDAFGVSLIRAETLVRTELKHTEIEATIESYMRAGIEQYEFLTSRDDKVCDDDSEACKELDGQRFPINDTEHLPPRHPNCRCSILAVLD